MSMATRKAKRKETSRQEPVPSGVSRGRILLVEDEDDLREMLVYNLSKQGYTMRSAARGEDALAMVRKQPPDLILLDLMLPGIDGLELCRTLKGDSHYSHIPVVMLTAKGEETDVVVGLEMGADDYIPKPFSISVLAARVRAVIRRRQLAKQESEQGSARKIELDRLKIDPERHEVRMDNKRVDLSATEFRLLHMLARRPGRVYTRQQIIDSLHDGFAAVTDRSVDVQIVMLRRKLGPLSDRIQTVRGVGYRYSDPE
jgi:two-component system phosphate regulon response regulator PhoB